MKKVDRLFPHFDPQGINNDVTHRIFTMFHLIRRQYIRCRCCQPSVTSWMTLCQAFRRHVASEILMGDSRIYTWKVLPSNGEICLFQSWPYFCSGVTICRLLNTSWLLM
jgi:hypothetical protein